jgi:hypothetical protein
MIPRRRIVREDTIMRTRSYRLDLDIIVHHGDAHEPASSMYRPRSWLIIVLVLSAIF